MTVAAVASCAAAAQGGAPPVDHRWQQAGAAPTAGGKATPRYAYLFAPSARWTGPMRWKYNPAGAPAFAADTNAVIALLQKSFDKWSSQCGIGYVYDGETGTPPGALVAGATYGPQPDGASVVGWGTTDPGLGAWTYVWYAQTPGERAIVDADVTLSPTNIVSLGDLDRLMTHEWGHALGLDHSDIEAAIMAGPPATHYNALDTPQPDDLRGCRCQYGLPNGVAAPYACGVPARIDFGASTVGADSPVQSVRLANSGNAPLSIQASTVDRAEFAHVAGCTPGTVVMPGEACTMQIRVRPAAEGGVDARLALLTNDGTYAFALAAYGVTPASAPTVEVVEYYNAALDHYFITWIAAEKANLDAGLTPTPWTRTGRSFRAFAAPLAGTSQVCRYYIPPVLGNSHFFGRSASECAAAQRAQPGLVLEDPDYMHVVLPTAGTCPAGTQPVYRLFNNRADANHRYTVDRALRDAMVADGWIAEGDGADRVAMCAPA